MLCQVWLTPSATVNTIVYRFTAGVSGETFDAEEAFLVTASAGDPEITVVPSASVGLIRDCPHEELLGQLAELFAVGAQAHGVRLLGNASIRLP